MKQLDIMGNEVDYFELNKPKEKVTESIKTRFRRTNGYLQGKTCKSCKYLKIIRQHYNTYYKCEKMGVTSSKATDIRLKDCACKLFESKEVNI